MRLLAIYTTLFIYSFTFGQSTDDPTDELLLNLKVEMIEGGVSEYFVVKRITYGQAFIFGLKDPNICIGNGYPFTMYVFWRSGNTDYIKKLDNCGEFNSIELSDTFLIDYYKTNIANLKKQEVERYKLRPDSIANGLIYSFTNHRSHSPLRYFWFYKDSTEFKKNFDTYNLTTEPDSKNINYNWNKKLAITMLNELCDEIIYSLNERQMFNRLK